MTIQEKNKIHHQKLQTKTAKSIGGNPLLRHARKSITKLGKINSDKAFEKTLSFMSSLYGKITDSIDENKPFIDKYAHAKIRMNNKKITEKNFRKHYNDSVEYFKNRQINYLMNNPSKVYNINGDTVIEVDNTLDQIAFNYDGKIDLSQLNEYFKTPLKQRKNTTEYVIYGKRGRKTISKIKPDIDYTPKKLIF
jgi:hypothetical protein